MPAPALERPGVGAIAAQGFTHVRWDFAANKKQHASLIGPLCDLAVPQARRLAPYKSDTHLSRPVQIRHASLSRPVQIESTHAGR